MGKFECLTGGEIVCGLLINVLKMPPIMERVENDVCGINWPNVIVAPMNGPQSNQTRAYTIVEKPHIFFFSAGTNSVVQVVSMANVDDIAVFETIALHIKRATRRLKSTAK